jgi:hypothetical protein
MKPAVEFIAIACGLAVALGIVLVTHELGVGEFVPKPSKAGVMGLEFWVLGFIVVGYLLSEASHLYSAIKSGHPFNMRVQNVFILLTSLFASLLIFQFVSDKLH